MKFELDIKNKHILFLVVIGVFVAGISYANAAIGWANPTTGVGHGVEEVGPGVFGDGEAGNYIFPGVSKVGIGTTTPYSRLHVADGFISVGSDGRGTANPRVADTSKNIIFVGTAAKSDYVISLQDDTGMVQHYWNAEPGASPTFLEGGENAGKLLFSPNLNDWFRLRWADGSGASAGDPITWTDHLMIQQNGDVIVSTGNVGIGTSSPGTKLVVDESTNNDAIILIDSGQMSSQYSAVDFADQGTRKWGIGKDDSNNFYIDEYGVGRVLTISPSDAYSAIAMGTYTTASGNYAIAIGYSSAATGHSSAAMGYDTTASGQYSMAVGSGTVASGHGSTAMGTGTIASGDRSTAMGTGTIASGDRSTAMGIDTVASGITSTAMGDSTIASGNYAMAMGREIEAQGKYSVAIALSDQDGLIVSQPNTMAIMGGYAGIGTTTPKGQLDVAGGVSIGSYAGVDTPPVNGIIVSGRVGIGTNIPGAKLDVQSGSTGTAISAVTGDFTKYAISGQGPEIAIYGFSSGNSLNSAGVRGYSASGVGISGVTNSGWAIYGQALDSGWAGYFDGDVKISGNLEVGSCTGCSEDVQMTVSYHEQGCYAGSQTLDIPDKDFCAISRYYDANTGSDGCGIRYCVVDFWGDGLWKLTCNSPIPGCGSLTCRVYCFSLD